MAAAFFSVLRPAIATAAPARASPCAIASPMPLLPPVTRATFPFKSNNSCTPVHAAIVLSVNSQLPTPKGEPLEQSRRNPPAFAHPEALHPCFEPRRDSPPDRPLRVDIERIQRGAG